MNNADDKYVPPNLRGGGGSTNEQGDGSGGNYGNYSPRGGYGQGGGYGQQGGSNYGGGYNQGGGYQGGGYQGGGYQGGGYQGGGYQGGGYQGGRGRGGRGGYNNNFPGYQGGYGQQGGGYGQQGGYGGYNNSFPGYNNNFPGYGGGGRGDRGGSSGGYGGGFGGPKKNALGFHGDERPNARLEQQLYHSGDGQTAGINFDKYDDIPVEKSAGCPEPYNEFTEETVGPQLLHNLLLSKYTKPTPVQKYSIPVGLSGGDLMACAQTGSGKTAGFLFPIISRMLKTGAVPEPEHRPGQKTCYITALVLAPTRELASQIYDEAQKFCYCTGIRPVVVYGGNNIQGQLKELELGADLLVATPGRLVDLIERGRIQLDCVKYLILDEADRMLDMGFEPQIRRIVQERGMPPDRQTFMFSATFPTEIQRLAGDFMHEYVFLAVGRVGAASKDVTQRVEWVEQGEKFDTLMDFLHRCPEGLILVFVETKRSADQLENFLYQSNFPASSIHGDKNQREREEALKNFKSGKTPILVATDVAARGLDIPNVTQVINFDMPSNIDDYVHRIGRTGRVGNIGHAISYVCDKNTGIFKELANLLIENEQECPSWLEKYHVPAHAVGGGRGRGRGKQNFGARDYRKTQAQSHDSNPRGGASTVAANRPSSGYQSSPRDPSSYRDNDNSNW